MCGLSPPQLAYVASTAKRIVNVAGRRSGKTVGAAERMHIEALTAPRAPVGYITLTRENAQRVIWEDLLEINEAWNLGGKVDYARLTIRHPFGKISLHGADTEREIRKIRSHKFKWVNVDECQSFADKLLGDLLTKVLRPTLVDYNGALVLTGTAPPAKVGRWYEIGWGSLSAGYERHHWTLRENAYLPAYAMGRTADEIFAEILKEEGWAPDDPTFLREYMGECVEDADARLYQYDPDINDFGELPAGEWRHVMGIDLGAKDATAFFVWGWRKHDPALYQIYEFEKTGLVQDDVINLAKPLIAKYRPVRVVIDAGGLGLMIANGMRKAGVPVQDAKKVDKGAFIKMFNSDLRTGKIRVRPDSGWVRDARLVEKDARALQTGKLEERKGGYHSDILDAALYSWREALHWIERPAPMIKAPEVALREARIAEVVRASKRPHWATAAEKLGYGEWGD